MRLFLCLDRHEGKKREMRKIKISLLGKISLWVIFYRHTANIAFMRARMMPMIQNIKISKYQRDFFRLKYRISYSRGHFFELFFYWHE